MDQTSVITGLTEERERLTAYLRGIDDAAWEHASLCEGWRARDVLAHLVGNVADVLNGRLEDMGSDAFNQRQIDERSQMSGPAMLDEWAAKAPQLEQFYAGLPAEQWDAPLPPFGTLGTGVLRQLYDLWCHAQDIRVPLGETPDETLGARAALDITFSAMPSRLAALAPTVGTLSVRCQGGERVVQGSGDAPLTIDGSAATLALLSAGRITLGDATRDGALILEGDLPDGFADAINYYGPLVEGTRPLSR